MTIVSANESTDTFGATGFVRARTGSREFAFSAATIFAVEPRRVEPRARACPW